MMKFKLVEDWDRLKESSSLQSKENRKLKQKYLKDAQEADLWKKYQVHHLDGTIVDTERKLKSSELENLVFVKKGMGAAIDDLHRIIHLVSKCGSVDNFVTFLQTLDTPSDAFIRVTVDDASNLQKIPVTLTEVATATVETPI